MDTLLELSKVYGFSACVHLEGAECEMAKCKFLQVVTGNQIIHLLKSENHYDALVVKTEKVNLGKGGFTTERGVMKLVI